jgi:hypothetical protein
MVHLLLWPSYNFRGTARGKAGLSEGPAALRKLADEPACIPY